jgi:hypothetical protein
MRITRLGATFSTGLLRKAEAIAATRVTVFFDEDARRVGVRFHNMSDVSAFALSRCGPNGSSAVLQSLRIWRNYSWIEIKKVSKIRLRAQLDKEHGIWFVTVPE